MTTLNEKWYEAIVKERDKELEIAEDLKSRGVDISETYAFVKAHGMNECLRIFDKVSAEHHLPLYHKFVKLLWGDELTDEEIKEQYTVNNFLHADLVEVADMDLDIKTMKEALKLKTTDDELMGWYWACIEDDLKQSLTEYVREKRNA